MVLLVGEEGEAFVAAFVASVAFMEPHLSNADVPSCKGRELRETNPASRVSTLWVTSLLTFISIYLLLAACVYL